MPADISGTAFAFGLITLITVVIVVGMWQIFATARARASAAREAAYQKLAEQSAAALQKTAAQEQRLAEGLDDLRGRMAAIEKLLREVG